MIDQDLFNSIKKQFNEKNEDCWDYHRFLLLLELLKESEDPEHLNLARAIGEFVYENHAKSDLVNHLYIERLGWKIEMAALARWLGRPYPFEWDEDEELPFTKTNWLEQVLASVYTCYLSYCSGHVDRARGHTQRLSANQKTMEDAFFVTSEDARRDALTLYLLYGLSTAHDLLLNGDKNKAIAQINNIHKCFVSIGPIELFQLTKSLTWFLEESNAQ